MKETSNTKNMTRFQRIRRRIFPEIEQNEGLFRVLLVLGIFSAVITDDIHVIPAGLICIAIVFKPFEQ